MKLHDEERTNEFDYQHHESSFRQTEKKLNK